MGSITHTPKSGELLTGTEYETDPHVIALEDSDIPATIARDSEVTSAISTHAAASDPHTEYQKESEKAQASGYASLDGTTKVPIAQLPTGTSGTTVALGNAAAGLITTHEGASDPHTGYRLESADHTHASSGLQGGQIAYSNLTGTPTIPTAGTTPSTQAFGDSAAGGADSTFSKNDHKHGFPALGTTPSTQAFGDAAAGGSATTPSKNDHKHAMPTLGYGLSGNSAPAVGLTTASAFVTATTSLSAATYADITGASVSLAAGTWLIVANVVATDTTTTAGLLVAAITDGSNNLVAEGAQSIPAGTATVSTWGHVGLCAIVSPGSTTTYKLRGARGTTTATATLVVQDGSPQNVANNATTNTDKGTGIFAVRIA